MAPIPLKTERITGVDGNEYLLIYVIESIPSDDGVAANVSVQVAPFGSSWSEIREQFEQAVSSASVVEADQQENA